MIEECRACGDIHDARASCNKKKPQEKKAKVKIIEQPPPKVIEYNGHTYELKD